MKIIGTAVAQRTQSTKGARPLAVGGGTLKRLGIREGSWEE
jgi:hypothetical protein